jgi:hypothetical protein
MESFLGDFLDGFSTPEPRLAGPPPATPATQP